MTQADVAQVKRRAPARSLAKIREGRLTAFLVALLILELNTIRVGSSGGSGDKLNTVVSVLTMGVLCLSSFPDFFRNVRVVLRSPSAMIFAVYLLWIYASLAWSVDRGATVVAWIPLSMAAFLSIAFADMKVNFTAHRIIHIALIVVLISWPVTLLFPSIGYSAGPLGRMQGIMNYCQHLAMFVLVAFLCIVIAKIRRELDPRLNGQVFWGIVVLLIVTTFACKSRTFTTYAFMALLVTLYVSFHRRAKLALVGGVLAGISILVMFPSILIAIYERGGANDLTLSGRLGIWIGTFMKIRQRPWLGYGFGSFSPDLVQGFTGTYLPPHAHNMWLQAAFETGVIGAALVTIFILSVIVSGHLYYRRERKPNYSQVLMIFALFSGLTSVFFGFKLVTVSGMVLLITVQELYRRQVDKLPTVPARAKRRLPQQRPAPPVAEAQS